MQLRLDKHLLLVIFSGIFLLLSLSCLFAAENEPELFKVRLYLFHSESCPHCKDELAYLESIKEKYPNLEISEFEVSADFKNLNIFKQVAGIYSLDGGVPVTIIGDQAIVGFGRPSTTGKEIEKAIEKCSMQPCYSKADSLLGKGEIEKYQGAATKIGSEKNKNSNPDSHNNHRLDVNIFGKEFCLESNSSVCLIGVVLGLADGINPCMFSVLMFMLTYLLAIGSRKRVLKAGVAFILTTFAVYFLFMYGIIKVVDVLQVAQTLRLAVTILAFLAGIIMIKDFFFYGRWISLEIPQRYKPKMVQLIKSGTVPSAVVLALFSSIVELPCTSGLPLAYTSILSSKNIYPLWYLFVYNLFFVLPLVVILVLAVVSWGKVERMEAWRNGAKKYMRLVSGLLLIIIAAALWLNWI